MKNAYNGQTVPADGKAIGYSGGELQVPDSPIIPFIEGDGIGRDSALVLGQSDTAGEHGVEVGAELQLGVVGLDVNAMVVGRNVRGPRVGKFRRGGADVVGVACGAGEAEENPCGLELRSAGQNASP